MARQNSLMSALPPLPRVRRRSLRIGRALARVTAGLAMPGVIAVAQSLPAGAAIEDLESIAECSTAEKWENQVRYLPLR